MRSWLLAILLACTSSPAAPSARLATDVQLYTVLLKDPRVCVNVRNLLARHHFLANCTTPTEEVRIVSAEFVGRSIDLEIGRLLRNRWVMKIEPATGFPHAR